ncbi:hypothetical protein Sjap_021289 [Stephania japonica]|uniref:Uncharacterized protein n=1 Tax=Stephania japonica TaxID=461633 RepID=A0AAP0ERY8_9MAGN
MVRKRDNSYPLRFSLFNASPSASSLSVDLLPHRKLVPLAIFSASHAISLQVEPLYLSAFSLYSRTPLLS